MLWFRREERMNKRSMYTMKREKLCGDENYVIDITIYYEDILDMNDMYYVLMKFS